MIERLKPYPKMKDSGVPWLGEVPEHWRVESLARLGQLFKGNGGSKEDEATSGVPCVRYGDLYTKHNFFIWDTKGRVTQERASAYTPIYYGDVLFAASGETVDDIGKSAVNLIQGEARCGGDVLVLRPSVPAVAEFLGYAADSAPARHQKAGMGRGFTVVHIYGTQLKRLVLVLPPLPEQAAIVDFLKHTDRCIQRYIGAKQKLIKLLEEQKQAIIHRAVTRGLDPAVRLKFSGVEWLGDVPEHWEVKAVRRLASFVTSGSRGWARYYSEDGDIFIQSGNLGRSMSLNMSFVQHVRPPRGAEGERTRVRRDDVLICITGALTGNVVLVDIEMSAAAFVNQHIALVRPAPNAVIPRYLARALHSEIGRIQFKVHEYGGTKQGLGLDDVKSALLPLPPIAEQLRICAELDSRLHDLEKALAASRREIALLRDLSTRLIADVVCGKLDVREAAARLPDDFGGHDQPDPIDDLIEADASTEGEFDELLVEAEA